MPVRYRLLADAAVVGALLPVVSQGGLVCRHSCAPIPVITVRSTHRFPVHTRKPEAGQ